MIICISLALDYLTKLGKYIMTYRLGIDLGGTKIEAILIDEHFQVMKRERVPTKREEGYEAILSRIVKLAKSIIKDVPDIESPIGICTPGTIESETGLLKNSNTVCLIGKPIQKDMEKELGIPVVMENDANCFALAEATIGAAKKYNVVFGVILGTGCGGGITMLRNIHRGANRIAGEWGHHCLIPEEENATVETKAVQRPTFRNRFGERMV